jgi:hypothetical protein
MRQTLFVFAFIQMNFLFQATAQRSGLISQEDFQFLQSLTRSVMDSSRILPGQSLPAPFGKNKTGGTLIRPGGRSTYPSFWIRDYAMSLETGFVSVAEQKHMLLLTASTQCNQTWITKGGSLVPLGAIADHIRVDDRRPIYFPGTYEYDKQGVKDYGLTPPYCDQFYFVQMAYSYVKSSSDTAILLRKIDGTALIDRLEMAFRVPPADQEDDLVYTNDAFRGVDFGFRDAVFITGKLAFASILKYKAANQLAEIFDLIRNQTKAAGYRDIAARIKVALATTFQDQNGMLRASTGKSAQPDVWATVYAVYLGMLTGEQTIKASRYLAGAYESGTLAYKGNVRHIVTTEDFNEKTAWEGAIVARNTYQNGAYWGTPVGWTAYTISKTNAGLARRLVSEYIQELRENDFREGAGFSSPAECITRSGMQGPVYLTSVSCPLVALRSE